MQRLGVEAVEIIEGDMSLSYPSEPGAVEVVRLFDADLDGARRVRG